MRKERYQDVKKGLREYLLVYKGKVPSKEEVVNYVEEVGKEINLLQRRIELNLPSYNLSKKFYGARRLTFGLPVEITKRIANGEYHDFLLKNTVAGYQAGWEMIRFEYGLLAEKIKGDFLEHHFLLAEQTKPGLGKLWSQRVYPDFPEAKVMVKDNYLPIQPQELEIICNKSLEEITEIADQGELFLDELARLPLSLLTIFAESVQLKRAMRDPSIN